MVGWLVFWFIYWSKSIIKLKTEHSTVTFNMMDSGHWQYLKLEEERNFRFIFFYLNGLRQQKCRWTRGWGGGTTKYQPQGLHGQTEEILDQFVDYCWISNITVKKEHFYWIWGLKTVLKGYRYWFWTRSVWETSESLSSITFIFISNFNSPDQTIIF